MPESNVYQYVFIAYPNDNPIEYPISNYSLSHISVETSISIMGTKIIELESKNQELESKIQELESKNQVLSQELDNVKESLVWISIQKIVDLKKRYFPND